MDIIILILVGALSGWIASKVFGLDTSPLVYILLGVIGGMVGTEVFGYFNISLGSGILGDIITNTAGAFLLVFVFRLMNRTSNK